MLARETRCLQILRSLRALLALLSVVGAACGREPESPPRRESQTTRRPDSASSGARVTRSAPYVMSENGLENIREDEAFVPRVYDDGVGNKTIGYGHMLRPGETFPGAISEAEGRKIFSEDVARIVQPALDRVKVPLTQNQIDALGSFIFNVGPGNFTRSVLPALNAGDHKTATAKMAQFVRGRNQRTGEREALRGLVRRRREEIDLFNSLHDATALLRILPSWFRAARTVLAVRRPATIRESSCGADICGRTPSRS